MKYLALALVLLLAFSAGCGRVVSQGKMIDEAKVANFLDTYPTTDQLIQSLGKPQQTERLASGEEKLIYSYHYRNPHWWTTDEVQNQKLEVWTRGNSVQAYHFVSGRTEDARTEAPR